MCRQLQMSSQTTSTTQAALAYAKQTIRPYYMDALPTDLRSTVIEETMKMLCSPSRDGSTILSTSAVQYLLAVLLGRDIKKLKVDLCCYYGCSHQMFLLKLFAVEGVGLHSLELTRCALLRLDCKLLYVALTRMKNLTCLTLRHIANDAVLQVVGLTCTKLAILDIADSRQVTDVGLKHLLLQVELRDKQFSQEQIQQTCTTWSRLKAMLSNSRTKNSTKKTEKRSVVLEYLQIKNTLCKTLRVLNLANTSVSSDGVLFALTHATELKSLGGYSEIGIVMDLIRERIEFSRVSLKLIEARFHATTSKRLELLARLCPKLEKLYILKPCHSAEALNLFPHITSLSIRCVPIKREWLRGFFNYLRRNGKNMSNLDFQMVSNETVAVEIDLREILDSCPNLHTLVQGEANVIWTKGRDPPPLRWLKIVQLGATDAWAIVKMLSLASELEVLHVYSCSDLSNRHVEMLRPAETTFKRIMNKYRACDDNSSKLTCFYIYEMQKMSVATVLRIFDNYKRLRQFGNSATWALDRDEVTTLKTTLECTNTSVDFYPSSHWLWNDCVPNFQ